MVTEAIAMNRESLSRQTFLAAILLIIVIACSYTICGAFSEKRGVFFGGIESEGEYRRILGVYRGKNPESVAPLSQKHIVSVSHDGTSMLSVRITYACKGGREEARLENMWNVGELGVLSPSGEPLEFTTEGSNPTTLVIRLPQNNQPIQQFALESTFQDPSLVSLQVSDRQRVYEFHHTYGPPIRYNHILNLPPDTKLLSCSPPPHRAGPLKGGYQILFKQELQEGETFHCRVVLEFPE